MKYLSRLRGSRAVDLPSGVVAVALTVAAFAAVFVVSARTLLFEYAAPRVDGPSETLVYLQRPVSVVRPVEPSLVVPAPRTREQPAAAARSRADTVSGRRSTPPTNPNSKPLAGPSSVFLPPNRAPGSTPSPFDAPRPRNPFLSEEPRTRAEMDSILAVMRHGIPLFAKTRTPTAAERDSAMRDQSRGRLVPGREAQVPGTAQMSVGLPLFAPGPSPAVRRRDSVANAEYVARLQRLQARVGASRESLRVADSMSRARMP